MKVLLIAILGFFAFSAFAESEMSTPTPALQKETQAPRTYLPSMNRPKKKKSSAAKPAIEKSPSKCANDEGKSIIPGDADYDSKCSGASTM